MFTVMNESVGGFRSESARGNFLRAFDVAMASWPDRTDHRVDTRFGQTAVSMAAGPGDRAPLVLLQGGGSTVAAWGPFVDVWRQERPVIALDTVWDAGRSEQTRPVTDGADTARWLEEVLSGLEIGRVHLVGYSYGGWIALNHLVESPARLLSVTAIEPPGAITGLPARAWWEMLRMLTGDERRYRSYLTWVRGGRLPESAMLDMLLSAKADFIQRGSPRPRRLTIEQWRTIRTPLQITLGGRSALVPTQKAAAVVQRHAAQADLRVLAESSHAVLVDEPQFVTDQVRDFTRRHDRVTQ